MSKNNIQIRHNINQAFLELLTLDERHQIALKARGLSDQAIITNGYRSVPYKEEQKILIVAELFMTKGHALFDVPGFYLQSNPAFGMGPRMIGAGELVIPMRTVKGLINSLCLRRDTIDNNGKRYIHFSCKNLNGVELSASPHFPLGDFSRDQIILTEGALKGDIIAQEFKVASACLAGVATWRLFLDTVDLTLYQYYDIAFDRDLENNQMVADSCLNLFKSLEYKGVNVRIAIWENSYKGIDDAIIAGQQITYLEKDDAKKYLTKVYSDNNWPSIDWGINLDSGYETLDNSWNEIKSLPEIYYPAPSLDFQIVPESMREWLQDTSNRMQSHAEFLFCAHVTLLSSIIGRSFCVKPKKFDNWKIIPHLWGLLVGLPSSKKSPCLSDARKFIEKIQHRFDEEYKEHLYAWQAIESTKQIELKSLDNDLKKLQKNKSKSREHIQNIIDEKEEIIALLASTKPIHKRIYVSDVTIEAFQEILRDNPLGVATIRDELSGFLMNLEKVGHENDRSFYLEAYNGSDDYPVARITRGSFKLIPCSSILGGIQPDALKSILIDGMKTGATNDGFTQRFQLLVWPEFSSDFEYIDRAPNLEARERVQRITDKMFEFRLNQNTESDNSAHFDDEAQKLFQKWLTGIERRARSGKISPPSLAAHVLKYPKLMCSLALIFELIERFDSNQSINEVLISYKNAELATQWCDFLEAHALKVYSNAVSEELAAAVSLGQKILSGEIKDKMPIREIYRKGWSHLVKKEQVYSGLEILEDLGWARLETVETAGAPKKQIKINSKVYDFEKNR